MCGIAGFVRPRGDLGAAEERARLAAMIGTLSHRGPDDTGVWSDGRAGLAHARLSIIDLSPAGHQPMASQDGSVWITYNGEIYNFTEIRTALREIGYAFKSRSDTEIIVNGWHAWGTGIFGRLRGMFALALWDRRRNRLILARDRVGQKPLYYAATGDAFLFGSEIKAVLAWPGFPRVADLAAIDQYLTLQYVPAPRTAFAGISRLPAAHYLVVESTPDGLLAAGAPTRYWRLPTPATGAARRRIDRAALQDELVARLEEAVRLRLMSDVPLGAFLSGGVDSSAVVAMMARAGGGRVKTFSIGFAAKAFDETSYAREVARRYGTEHEEFVVEPDAVAILPRLVWHYGEPFADPSAIPTWYVSEMARRRVTVALTGDGGDEAFLGYSRYGAMRRLAQLDRAPAWSRHALERLLARVPAARGQSLRLARIREALRSDPGAPEARYGALVRFFADEDKRAGYGEALQAELGPSALALLAPYFAEAGTLLAGANWADLHTYLPDDLLVKVDVASMAHGLEARSPLLDHELLEFVCAIPPELRMAGGTAKALFKSAMAPFLPRAVLRRRKMGFSVPVAEWLRGPLKELAHDTLLSDAARARGLFGAPYVRTLLDEHCRGASDHHRRLWALLMLELWFGMWIDAPAASAVLRPAA